MTETSPLGTVGHLLPKHQLLSPGERMAVQVKQGRPMYGKSSLLLWRSGTYTFDPAGVELKIVDDSGKVRWGDTGSCADALVGVQDLPRDGKAFGDLLVRGPWTTNGYYKMGKGMR